MQVSISWEASGKNIDNDPTRGTGLLDEELNGDIFVIRNLVYDKIAVHVRVDISRRCLITASSNICRSHHSR